MKCGHPNCNRTVHTHYQFRAVTLCSFQCWWSYETWYKRLIYGGRNAWSNTTLGGSPTA